MQAKHENNVMHRAETAARIIHYIRRAYHTKTAAF